MRYNSSTHACSHRIIVLQINIIRLQKGFISEHILIILCSDINADEDDDVDNPSKVKRRGKRI